MASRAHFFRFRDRASFKPSEVVGLFIISLLGWMVFFLLCATIDFTVSIFGG